MTRKKKNSKDEFTRANCPILQEETKPAALSPIESDRIRQWKERNDRKGASFSYLGDRDGNNVSLSRSIDDDLTLTRDQKQDIYLSTLYAATGSADKDYSARLFAQTIAASIQTGNCNDGYSQTATAVQGALLSLSPQDEIEGMLISRLLVLHDNYMLLLIRAASAKQDKERECLLNQATKLMRVYNETLETLNRHRRKGEQRVIVQHVNVNEGGQAIVGHVEHGGGGNATI